MHDQLLFVWNENGNTMLFGKQFKRSLC